MPTIALTYPAHTNLLTLIETLGKATGFPIYTDADLIKKTGLDHGIDPALLQQVVQVAPIAFNNFTHEREKALAALGKTLADHIRTGNCIFSGIICQLIPDPVSHIYRILAVSSPDNRIKTLVRVENCDACHAASLVEQADKTAVQWTTHIKSRSPWLTSAYDLVLDMDKGEPADRQTEQIIRATDAVPFSGQTPREKEVADLAITTDVHLALASLGGGLTAESDNGHVTVTLDKKRMNLPETQARIKKAVKSVPGVISLKIKIGPRYYESDMVKTFDFDTAAGPWKLGRGGN